MRCQKFVFFVSFVQLCLVLNHVDSVKAANETSDDFFLSEKFLTPCTTPKGGIGFCRDVRTCQIFVDALKTANENLKKFMRDSICGPNAYGITLICCGKELPIFEDTPAEIPPAEVIYSTRAPPLAAQTGPKNPLPKNCGKQNIRIMNRIHGGKDAQLGEFPWLGRLRHRTMSGIEQYGCTGFVIHKKFILTASHCVNPTAIAKVGPLYAVVLGDHDSSKEEDCVRHAIETVCSDPPLVADVKSMKTVLHPNYVIDRVDINHYYDIAIVELKKAINFTDYIRPICLPDKPVNNTEMWLSGWGKTETGRASTVKLKVSVPRITNGECAAKYTENGVTVDKSQVCAGGVRGRDSCLGDSGGPLMVATRDEDIWYAEGIVSFGMSCGLEGWPGVYTNIPHFLPWIKKKIVARLASEQADRIRNRLRNPNWKRKSGNKRPSQKV